LFLNNAVFPGNNLKGKGKVRGLSTEVVKGVIPFEQTFDYGERKGIKI